MASRLGVYDNWQGLVKAVIEREHLHHLALCDSLSSSASTTSYVASLDANVACTGGGVVAKGTFVFPVPAIAPVNVNGWKRKLKNHFFCLPGEQDPKVHQLRQFQKFTLQELQIATNEFSNQLVIGRGGNSKVYKGQLADGSLVAVKRLDNTQKANMLSRTEIGMISMVVHPNLLRLRGFCITPTEMLLVYPFMSNGSVASCLRERSESRTPLHWPTRGRIALGSARGLAYLHDHCEQKIVHRDVKAANIFLNEDFEAVIGDFGMAKLMNHNDTYVTAAIHGTVGHIAPEYISSFKLSEKTDVFAYGITLLELITGQRASRLARLANQDNVKIFDWVKGLLKEKKKLETFVDANLGGNYIHEEMEKLIQVAILCLHDSPSDRPKMSDVVRMLQGDGFGCLDDRWQKWQKMNEEIFSY